MKENQDLKESEKEVAVGRVMDVPSDGTRKS